MKVVKNELGELRGAKERNARSHSEAEKRAKKKFLSRMAKKVFLEYETTAYIKNILEELVTTDNRWPMDRRPGMDESCVLEIDKAFIKRVESVAFMEEYHASLKASRHKTGFYATRDGLREDLMCYDKLKRYEKIEQDRLAASRVSETLRESRTKVSRTQVSRTKK